MTKETLEARIVELRNEQTMHLRQADALGGAIQDCEFWLAQLAKETEPKGEANG